MHLSRTSRARGGSVKGMSDRVGEVEEGGVLVSDLAGAVFGG